MPDKVLFTRSVDIVPMRKGIYKDIVKDTRGFRLLVTTEKAGCQRLSCEGCDKQEGCELRDTAKNMPSVAKKKHATDIASSRRNILWNTRVTWG